MLNLILNGSQYIYQNLIKNIWLPAVTWTAYIFCTTPSEFPAQWFLLGQQQESITTASAIWGASSQLSEYQLHPSGAMWGHYANCSKSPLPEKLFIITYNNQHTLILQETNWLELGYLKKKHQAVSETGSQVQSPPLLIAWACSDSLLTAVNISSRNIFGFSPSLNIHAIGNIHMK